MTEESPVVDGRRLRDMQESELRGLIETYRHRVERFEESIRHASLAIEDIGWKPLGGANDPETGLDLDHIKEVSKVTQALVTVNPLAKRGIGVRTSYVWGSGVRIKQAKNNRSIHRTLGTTEAQFELERTLACDGNLFLEMERNGQKVRRIPLTQIAGAAEHPDEPGVITHIRRKYRRYRANAVSTTADTLSGSDKYEEVDEWIPTLEDESDEKVIPVGGERIKVNKTKRIKHVAINRLVGWWWGVPDLYAILPWSKAYKEYLEDCNVLNKAYAQFAWQFHVDTKKGVDNAAAEFASAPAVDPATGRTLNVGGTMISSPNARLSALQTVRPVDFSAGRPMAALIAAGLEIPLQVLTADAGQGGSRTVDQTLDTSTKNAMIARQQMMDSALGDVAEYLRIGDFDIEWPEIDAEPAHRQMQALDQAVRLGALYGDEMRARAAQLVRVDIGTKKDPPSAEELPAVLQLGPSPQPEPPSYGDHELRDEGTQDHTEED